jgi:hypothetical protein
MEQVYMTPEIQKTYGRRYLMNFAWAKQNSTVLHSWPLKITASCLQDLTVQSDDQKYLWNQPSSNNDDPERPLIGTNFGYRVVLSAPGIEKVLLTPVRNGYKVTGDAKMYDMNFQIDDVVELDDDTLRSLDKVTYSVHGGLVFINFFVTDRHRDVPISEETV